jgi:hypothetical protein
MSSFTRDEVSKASSDGTKTSDDTTGTIGGVKSLQELAATTLALTAAKQLKESESKEDIDETREIVESIEDSFGKSKNTLALVFVLDNTASQNPSWDLTRKTLRDLIPFLDSRHGEDKQFQITYEIRIIYANDYNETHVNEAATAKRTKQKYIAQPRIAKEGQKAVVGELCRISSDSTIEDKKQFLETISRAICYGGSDGAEAYAPALELAMEHIQELNSKYGDTAVISCIFCGDDVPHGCNTQKGSHRDNWEEGDPSGVDWFEVISRFPYPIHCLSPPHADEDSRCALGYAVKKTGGFHLVVNQESSKILLRLLMAEMKLSWLVERNLKDMESATPEEISAKIAELVNKESFEKPDNTVPVDPRIEKIEEEIGKSGYSPSLMRSATDAVPKKRFRSDFSAPSTVSRGVSGPGMMRALRTATGGTMHPVLMRAVSDSVAVNTGIEEDTEEDEEEGIEPLGAPPALLRSPGIFEESSSEPFGAPPSLRRSVANHDEDV